MSVHPRTYFPPRKVVGLLLAVIFIVSVLVLDLIHPSIGKPNTSVPSSREDVAVKSPKEGSGSRMRVAQETQQVSKTTKQPPWKGASQDEQTAAGRVKRLMKEQQRLHGMTQFLAQYDDSQAAEICEDCEVIFDPAARKVLAWKIKLYLEAFEPLLSNMTKALDEADNDLAQQIYSNNYRQVRKTFLSGLKPRELFWLGLNGYLDHRTPQQPLAPSLLVRRPQRELGADKEQSGDS